MFQETDRDARASSLGCLQPRGSGRASPVASRPRVVARVAHVSRVCRETPRRAVPPHAKIPCKPRIIYYPLIISISLPPLPLALRPASPLPLHATLMTLYATPPPPATPNASHPTAASPLTRAQPSALSPPGSLSLTRGRPHGRPPPGPSAAQRGPPSCPPSARARPGLSHSYAHAGLRVRVRATLPLPLPPTLTLTPTLTPTPISTRGLNPNPNQEEAKPYS